MKFTLLLWILPSISAYLYSLEDVNVKCPATPEKVEIRAGGPLNGYTQFYGIPAESDEDASFNLIEVIINTTYNTKLEYPENAKISSFPIETSDVPKSCYAATEPLNLKGVIYFVDKNYTDMDVYQSRGNNYTVEISKNYTTVFSRKSTGSTLGSFVTDNDTSFEIHSGLPGDNDNLIFQYDSSQKVDQLYIAQNYFYVLNSGKPFSFTVSDKIVDPSTTTFGLNGFIMSPNFPAAPPDSYKDLNVKLEKREVEKMIKVKVSAIQSPDVEKAGEEGIVLDEKPSVTVKFGKFIGTIETNSNEISPGDFSEILPITANTIEIVSVNSAYTVQFEIEDVPTSTTATPSSTTKLTVTPKPVTGGTCPPTTCPVVTCPVSTPCSCLTTTTELSTTTMGASTLSVTSIITIFFVYSLF